MLRTTKSDIYARMPLSAWSQNGAGAGMLISICQHLCADLISRLYVTYVTYVTHFTNPPPTFRERINREVVVVLLMPTHIYIYSYIYIYIVCVCQHQIST